MFKSEAMQRIRVYSHKEKLNALVETLYEFGAIHVTQAKHSYLTEYGQALNSFKDISATLIALRSVEKILNLKSKPAARNDVIDPNLSELLKQVQKIDVQKIIELNNEREKQLQELESLQKQLEELAPFAEFDLDKNFASLKSVGITLFQTSSSDGTIQSELKQDGMSASFRTIGKTKYCQLVFEKTKLENASKIITKHASKTISVPSTISAKTFKEELQIVQANVAKVQRRITEITDTLKQTAERDGKEIVAIRASLEIESKKAQLPFNFGATANLVAVEAWIPKQSSDKIQNDLGKKVANSHVEFIETNELPPTKQNNPAGVASFEELVKFFSLPKATELDPTALVAVSFPLFFGMIVGDIGYGLVSLIGAIALKMKISKDDKMMQSIGTMLAASAISSMIFGYIFGEFFGFEHIFGYALHPLIHRAEEHGLALLMALSILFGMIHLAIGYLIGAWQAFAHHHAKHGYAKICWLGLEFSLALFIAGSMQITFLHFIEPAARIITPNITGPLILLSVIGIGVFEGPTALFEIPGLLSNIFSYLRIMALGVSGVIIALILNQITQSISFATPVAIITSLLLLVLFVLGHIGSIALALFESMIQSMRLQYVEFFSKFFEGGGFPFTPLNSKRRGV